MTMITPSYLGETIEYSSLHACRSTLEDPTIYVVTAEQIRRSAARNIPEALRLVPGVHVAQISADQWQVSIRGFDSQFVDKLLVLVDGRSVYNTSFSGVYWDTQEILMDDIDRIEVVRGPGGSLWGTNAVNGVINVVTKKASDTLGTLVSMTSSSLAPYDTSVRYGGRAGANGFFRIYAKAVQASSLNTDLGPSANDGWQDIKTGFRGDWAGRTDSLTLSGAVNSTHLGSAAIRPVLSPPYTSLLEHRFPAADANLTAQWQRTSGVGKGAQVLAYYSYEDRDDPAFGELHDTLNVDAQIPFDLSRTNHVTGGIGYRWTRDAFQPGTLASITQLSTTQPMLSAFVRDEWKLNSKLTLAAGLKAEHNRYTGWELQPNASLTWNPSKSQTVWGAVSRAVRTPSVADELSTVPITVFPGQSGLNVVTVGGDPDFKSEVEVSSEIGWRIAPSPRFLIDATAFYNQYTRLRSYEAAAPFMADGVTMLPQTFGNDLSATTAGFELATRYQVTPTWQVEGSYSLFSDHFYFADGIPDLVGTIAGQRGGSTPQNQFGIRSSLDLRNKLEVDTSLKYTQGVAVNSIAAYARLDLRLGWHASSTTEFSVGGQNLLGPTHVEALQLLTEPDAIPRSFFVKATFKF